MGPEFWLYFAVGFAAQLVDGALGMAYGVVTTTVLLANGQTTLRLTTTANEHGNWTLLLTPAVLTQLGDGTVTLELRQTDPAGNLSPTAVHSLDIRATPLSERVRIDPLSGDDLLTPGEQALGVTVSGQGPAGTRLSLRFESPNGTLEGSVDIGADGRWQYVDGSFPDEAEAEDAR